MIPDKLFKSLNHICKDYKRYLNGQYLEDGYKPDYVLKKNEDYIIFESENCSSRKTYVGGLVKAAHFLQKNKTGKLIFIIVPKDNTKASSIASHLKTYLNWIGDKTNLKDVYVIEASLYYKNDKVLEVGCTKFNSSAFKV